MTKAGQYTLSVILYDIFDHYTCEEDRESDFFRPQCHFRFDMLLLVIRFDNMIQNQAVINKTS